MSCSFLTQRDLGRWDRSDQARRAFPATTSNQPRTVRGSRQSDRADRRVHRFRDTPHRSMQRTRRGLPRLANRRAKIAGAAALRSRGCGHKPRDSADRPRHPAERSRPAPPTSLRKASRSAAAAFSSSRCTVAGSGNRHDVIAARQYPGDRQLCRGTALGCSRAAAIRRRDRGCCRKFSPVKRGMLRRASLVPRSSGAPDRAGQKPAAERAVGDKADAELLA